MSSFGLVGALERSEAELAARLELERVPLPDGLEVRAGALRGRPASIEARGYAGPKIAYARFVSLRGDGIEIANLLCFGSPAHRLPIFGADLVAVGPRRAMLAADLTPSTHDQAFWGDLLAVGTDSGVIFLDPLGKRSPARVPDSPHTRSLVFSPSGHRLYAAGSGRELLVIDRFGHSVLKRIVLPGTAAALRVDFFGNWLLARAAAGDSVWIVDLDAERVVGTVSTPWDRDLPAVAAPRTLVARRDKDVVALDLASPALPDPDSTWDMYVAEARESARLRESISALTHTSAPKLARAGDSGNGH